MSAAEDRWLGITFIAVGGLMLLTAAVSTYNTLAFLKSAQRAQGIVKELNHGRGHPQIGFLLPSGEKSEFSASGWISYDKGQRAQVLYVLDKDGLPDARLDDRGDLWYSAVGRAALGLVFVVVGAIRLCSRNP